MSQQNINWNLITQGNTQKRVNQTILRSLFEYSQSQPLTSLLDAPCGQGDFLKSFKLVFPDSKVEGYDLYCEPLPEVAPYFKKGDIKNLFQNIGQRKFDVISHISGLMVLDQASNFISEAKNHLNDKGFLILTNDNILTIRDRLSFLFFGHLKRFKLLYSANEGNWNVVLIQGIWKHLKSSGYRIEKIEYTSFYPEDFFFLPLALILYPFMWLHLFFGKGEMDRESRKMLFPFSALLARHYVVYARKTNQ